MDRVDLLHTDLVQVSSPLLVSGTADRVDLLHTDLVQVSSPLLVSGTADRVDLLHTDLVQVSSPLLVSGTCLCFNQWKKRWGERGRKREEGGVIDGEGEREKGRGREREGGNEDRVKLMINSKKIMGPEGGRTKDS